MKNARTKTIFYLDLKHVHKYGSAKFQPNPIFSSQQIATESAESVAEEKKKKKVCNPLRGSRPLPKTINDNSAQLTTHIFMYSVLGLLTILFDVCLPFL